jgi:hypothetical protein
LSGSDFILDFNWELFKSQDRVVLIDGALCAWWLLVIIRRLWLISNWGILNGGWLLNNCSDLFLGFDNNGVGVGCCWFKTAPHMY